MNAKTYDQKWQNIQQWTAITEHYWHQCRGELHNVKDFWNDTLHSMTADDWWDWVDIQPSIKIQYEQYYRRYANITVDTEEIRRRLMLSKHVTKERHMGYNHPAFRLFMALHDLVNDIQGTPTVQYKHQNAEPDEELTVFERLFDA